MTALFVDIVGSTTFAEAMDPEDWKAVVDAAMHRFRGVVEANGGHVAQLLGDGMLAFFGAPVAHEDDPLRAIRAGLGLIDASRMVQLPALDLPGQSSDAGPRQLAVRVGVSTGEVIVGEVGGPTGGEYLAVGDTVNVAARLQALAPPMGVMASEATYRLVASAVEAEPVGTVALKGRQAAMHVFRVTAILPGAVRGRTPHVDLAVVGRDQELATFSRAIARAEAGRGTVIDLVGDPGIGKTRLLQAWQHETEAKAPGAVRWVAVGCDVVMTGQPYAVAGAILRSMVGCGLTASDAVIRTSLAVASRAVPDERDAVALWAWMLGLPRTPVDAEALAGLDGRALQTRAAQTLRGLASSLAGERPVVLVVEDVQWIDPSSAAVVTELLGAVAERAIVVCLSRRPDATPGAERIRQAVIAVPDSAAIELAIGPLGAAAQRRLATNLLGEEVPPELGEMIRRRCDGNPLFIEEVVEALRDRGILRRTEEGLTLAADEAAPIPPSLQGLLHARLDALPAPVRSEILVGSVIGREFEQDLSRSVAVEVYGPSSALDLNADAAGLVTASARGGGAVVFRHALVQEAAYARLTREDRRRIHGLVGRRLEQVALASGNHIAAASVLTHHFERAQDFPAAMRYGRMAAERATETFAIEEAGAMYAAAIAAARALVSDDGAEANRVALAELLAADGALLRIGQPDEALTRCDDALATMPAGRAVWRARVLMTCGDVEMARRSLDAADAQFAAASTLLGDEPPTDESEAPGWWAAWLDLKSRAVERAYWRGDATLMHAAIEELEGPLAIHGTPAQQADHYHNRAEQLMLRDRFVPSDEVLALMERAIEANGRHGLRRALAFDHFWLGFTCLWRREQARAESELRAAITLAGEIGDPLVELRALAYLCILLRRQRRVGEAGTVAERTMLLATRLGQDSYRGYGLSTRAWLALLDGDRPSARRDAAAADDLFVNDGSSFPFRWLSAWTLIACEAAEGLLRDAAARCPALLDEGAQPLPRRLAATVDEVLAAAELDTPGDDRALRQALDRALSVARQDGYL